MGVTPSFFSSHTYYWGDRHAAIFMGPERAANMSPARWALDAGIRYSSHADTPVTPMLPLQVVWSQVERRTTGGAILGPWQRVSRMEALRAVTIDAAWQVFLDGSVGSPKLASWPTWSYCRVTHCWRRTCGNLWWKKHLSAVPRFTVIDSRRELSVAVVRSEDTQLLPRQAVNRIGQRCGFPGARALTVWGGHHAGAH